MASAGTVPWRIKRPDRPPEDPRAPPPRGRSDHLGVAAGGGLRLEYRVGRPQNIAGVRGCNLRVVEGQLRAPDGALAGLAEFYEWAFPRSFEHEDLIEALDTESGNACDLAEAVAEAWEDLFDVGSPILEFHRLWVAPAYARGSAWAAPCLDLVRQRREARRPSILVLKPFPLEYEGALGRTTIHADGRIERTDGGALERGLEVRMAAMRRLYARVLGVAPLARDWMWSRLDDGVPDPSPSAAR